MFPAVHANLDSSFVSISPIKNWKHLVKKNYEVRQKKKSQKQKHHSTQTLVMCLQSCFCQGRKGASCWKTCNMTSNVTFFPPLKLQGEKIFYFKQFELKVPQLQSTKHQLAAACHLLLLNCIKRQLKNKPFLIRMSFLSQQFTYMELHIMRNPYNDVRYHNRDRNYSHSQLLV